MPRPTFSYDFAKTGLLVTLHTDVSNPHPEVTTQFLNELARHLCDKCGPIERATVMTDCMKIEIVPETMHSKVQVMQFLSGFCMGYDIAFRPLGMMAKTRAQRAAYQIAVDTKDPDAYEAALRLSAEAQEAAVLTQMRIKRALDSAM